MNCKITSAIFGALVLSTTSLAAQRGGAAAAPPSIMGAGIFPVPHPTMDQYLKLDKIHHTVWAGEGPLHWKALPTVAAITANDLRSRLYPLSDDSMHGRVVATEGHVRATQMIAEQFKKMGLEPGGDNGTFFQTLPYGPTSIDSTKIALSVAGEQLVWKKDWSPLAAAQDKSYGPQFTGNNVATVFAGRWLDNTTPLDPAMLKGKVLVFLPGAAPAGGGGRGGRGGGAATETRPREADAALVLMVNFDPAQPNLAAFTPGRGNTLRSSVPGGGASITTAVAEKIFGKPIADLKPGDVGKPVSGSFDYAPKIPATPARNVIAIRRGSDPLLKEEYVVIGAHNDHVAFRGRPVDHDSLRAYNRVMKPQGANDNVQIGSETAAQWEEINKIIKLARTIRPPRLDSIMNGADDDGSGTAVLMEIAEAFAKGPAPKRSIVFVSHAGEEAGMLGSSTFTDWPTIDRTKIIAAFNMDMLGKGRAIDVNLGGPNSVQLLGSRRLSTAFGNMFDSVNATRKEPMAIDYTWEMFNRLNRFCRSDQVSYFRYDIPVTYISLGYAVDYHMATDEPQYIDYEHSARLGRYIHDVVEATANRKDRFVNDGIKQSRFQSCTTG